MPASLVLAMFRSIPWASGHHDDRQHGPCEELSTSCLGNDQAHLRAEFRVTCWTLAAANILEEARRQYSALDKRKMIN